MNDARGMVGVMVVMAAAAPALAFEGLGSGWSEDFDSYATGSLVTCSLGVCSGPNNWTAWDNSVDAAGGLVTTDFAHSGPNALSVTNIDDMVVQFADDQYNDGVYKLSLWVYIQSVQTDNCYFILLNQYDGMTAPAWSLDLEFDGATGKVRDFETGAEVDLVTDAWVLVEVIMNLNDDPTGDTCSILYNGIGVSTRNWSQGGTSTLQAIDLWGDMSQFEAYYDDFVLEELPETGACCLPSGVCISDSSVGDCVFADGDFIGFGSVCALADCPVLGPDGWIVDAPFTWIDDSGRPLYQTFPCDATFGFNSTVQWEVTIPLQAMWTFSVCGSLSWDSVMGLGTTPCATDVAFDDDGGCDIGGTDSAFTVDLAPGVYYLTLAGASNLDFGSFTLVVSHPSEVECPPGGLPEGEPLCIDDSVDTFNGGCNSDPPVFSSISCGDTICGESGSYDFFGNRLSDTDWYKLALGSVTQITWSGEAGFPYLLAVIDNGGVDECPVHNFLVADTGPPASNVGVSVCLPAGTWYLFAGISDSTDVLCGTSYVATLDCDPCFGPSGACCFPDGACSFIEEQPCQIGGGAWLGAAFTCETANCPQPPGACCFFGTCVEVPIESCDSLSGTFLGDFTLCTATSCLGACCFDDGTCAADQTVVECDGAGGIFQGFSTTCGASECPVLGGDGWIVTAPFGWEDDSCNYAPLCPGLGPGRTVQFEVTVPFEADWQISACGSSYDTLIALGTAECLDDLGSNDDGCPSGSGSVLNVHLDAGTYFLTVTGPTLPDCGPFNLSMSVTTITLDDPQEFFADSAAALHAFGDVDDDGDLDIVAILPDIDPGTNGRIQVFLNQGSDMSGWLGLVANTPITVGLDPSGVAVEDFDGDFSNDLAVTNRGDATVSILINDGSGNGTFLGATDFAVGADPSAIRAGNFIVTVGPGGDPFDLAVAERGADNTVILENDGLGSFTAVVSIPSSLPCAMEPEDLDNDKDTDLVIAECDSARLTVWINDAFPSPGSLQTIALGADPVDLSVADIDLNGFKDIVSANADGTLSVILNQGGFVFDPAIAVPVGIAAYSVVAVDLDDEGDADLAAIVDLPSRGRAAVVLQTDSQRGVSFGVPIAFDVLAEPNYILALDVNADARPDLATVNTDDGPTGGSVTVLLNVLPLLECAGDIDGGGEVGFPDLLAVLAAWSPAPGSCIGCPEDLDGDGDVDFQDLLGILANWGPCPRK